MMATLLTLLIVTPLASAALAFGLRAPSQAALRQWIAVAAAAVETVLALWIAWGVAHDGVARISPTFAIDAVSALMLAVTSVVSALVACFAIGYLRVEEQKGIITERQTRLFFILLSLVRFAVVIAVTTIDLGLMWVAIEATTLATAFLVSFYNWKTSIEAAWKFLIINSVGLLMALFGIVIMFIAAVKAGSAMGGTTWAELTTMAHTFDPTLMKLGFIFILVGYGTKVGLAPMHTWLPRAYGIATSPASALLSSVLSSTAFIAILRLKALTDASVGGDFTSNLLVGFAVASVLVAASLVYLQSNAKRMIANSSIENYGLMAFGAACGPLGMFAALLQLVAHALTKALLFFCAGNMRTRFGSTRIKNIRGVLNVLPVTGPVFLLGILIVMGFPPSLMFVSELSLFRAGLVAHPWATAAIVGLLAVMFVGMFRRTSQMLNGEAPEGTPVGESSAWTVWPLLVLLLLVVGLGIWIPAPLLTLLESSVSLLTA